MARTSSHDSEEQETVAREFTKYRLSWVYFNEDFVLKRIDEIFASYGNARLRAKMMFYSL